MFHGGFTFVEAWNIPISWRQWFIGRINKEFDKQRKAQEGGQSPDEPLPTIARLREAAQQNSPSRLRRFE